MLMKPTRLSNILSWLRLPSQPTYVIALSKVTYTGISSVSFMLPSCTVISALPVNVFLIAWLDSSFISYHCCFFLFFLIAFLLYSVQNLYWDLCYMCGFIIFTLPIVVFVYQPKCGSTIPSISFWALQSSQGKLKSTSWEVNEVIWPKSKRWINTNY